MFRTFLLLGITVAIFTAVGLLIPDAITASIDGAIVYFLSFIWSWDSVIPVQTLMTCLLILTDFFASMSVFYLFYWILNMIR